VPFEMAAGERPRVGQGIPPGPMPNPGGQPREPPRSTPREPPHAWARVRPRDATLSTAFKTEYQRSRSRQSTGTRRPTDRYARTQTDRAAGRREAPGKDGRAKPFERPNARAMKPAGQLLEWPVIWYNPLTRPTLSLKPRRSVGRTSRTAIAARSWSPRHGVAAPRLRPRASRRAEPNAFAAV